MTVADRLSIALKRSGKKKVELARHLKVSPSAITQWFNRGTKAYDAVNFVRAAKFLGVSPEWLIDGNGDEPPGRQETSSYGESGEAAGLSADALDIAKLWQGLNEKNKEIAAHMIRTFSQAQKRKRGDSEEESGQR